MKSFLITALALLLYLPSTAISAPTPESLDNLCSGGPCDYATELVDTPSHSAIGSNNGKHTRLRSCTKLTIFSDLNTVDDHDSKVMPVKGIEEATAQVEIADWLCEHHHKCPLGYKLFDLGGDRCRCTFLGGWKRDTNLGEPKNFRIPMNPHEYCKNSLKGKCGGGTTGLWNQRTGRCYCGTSKASDSSAAAPTTFDVLTSRLLPLPLRFPTGISNTDWTAVEVTLVLLDESIKTQTGFHQICTGEKILQAFGFKLDIFQKICSPEISIPVAEAEIVKAQTKVYSALWIDTVLQKHNNDFHAACEEAKSPGGTESTSLLDKQWIVDQLCYPKEVTT
jgi:hypothetical protein